MKYRRLGKTNLKVSVIGVGTWQFGGEWGKEFDQPEVDAIFDTARALGVNLIDTAECYGDHTSEQLIGGAIQRDRANWIVATKFGHQFHGYLNRTDTRTPDTAARELEASLRALRTDYVDLWQYHSWGDDTFFNDDVMAVTLKARDQGKVRHIGNSVGKNTNVDQIDASTARAIEAIQIIYNRLDRAPEDASFPSCVRQDLGVLARVPLASGFLTGKYQPGATFPEGDLRSNQKPEDVTRKLEAVQQIQQREVPTGVPMAQWALAWGLQHPAVSATIPGVKSPEQMESNAKAAELSDLVRDNHPQAWKD